MIGVKKGSFSPGRKRLGRSTEVRDLKKDLVVWTNCENFEGIGRKGIIDA